MLKKPIKAGRVYMDGHGKKRGPMAQQNNTKYPWVCQTTGNAYSEKGVFQVGFETDLDLASRVKTPKADKPAKVKKWQEAWVVMKNGAQAGPFYTDDPFWAQNAGDAFTIHRARVRTEPEE